MIFDLLFRGKKVGVVSYQSLDQPWIVGTISCLVDDQSLRRQMAMMVAEPPMDLDTAEFEDAFLDEANWHLRDGNGELLEISVPAVHEKTGEVFWRWRPASPGGREPFVARLPYLRGTK